MMRPFGAGELAEPSDYFSHLRGHIAAGYISGDRRRMLRLAELFRGAAAATLDTGHGDLLLAEVVEVELVRVLATKIGWERERIEDARALLSGLAVERVPAPPVAEEITGDPDDDAVLASAVDAGAAALVSGDRRHLLPVSEHRRVRILTPQRLLQELGP